MPDQIMLILISSMLLTKYDPTLGRYPIEIFIRNSPDTAEVLTVFCPNITLNNKAPAGALFAQQNRCCI
jgi:hypothetical protein